MARGNGSSRSNAISAEVALRVDVDPAYEHLLYPAGRDREMCRLYAEAARADTATDIKRVDMQRKILCDIDAAQLRRMGADAAERLTEQLIRFQEARDQSGVVRADRAPAFCPPTSETPN